MTFEKDFPSLKNRSNGSEDMEFYWKRDIQENCLDRKKVLEAIEKSTFEHNEHYVNKEKLKEELDYDN